MRREHDEQFARQAIQSRALTPAQVMACRDVLAELESAGVTKLLAAVAVDQGVLTRDAATKLVAAINQKSPGMHPPLAAPVEAPAPAKAVRRAAPAAPSPASAAKAPSPPPARPPARSASRPAPSPAPALRSQAPKGEGGPAKSGSKLFLILGAVAAVAVLAVAAVVLTSGPSKTEIAKKPPPVEPEPVKVAVNPAPKPEPKPEVKPEPKPEPKPQPPPEPRVETKKPPPPPPGNDLKKQLEEQLAERKKEGQARLDEVKKELAQERKDAEQLAEAARLRVGGRKISLVLTSKETLKDVVIKSWTFHGADLDVGGREMRITWDTVEPASCTAAADAMFDPKRAQDQFDRGRFFVARRRWKEAQAAFAAAAKLGQGFESRVLEFSEVLDRLSSGQGGFRGSARRPSDSHLLISWDFNDAKQLEDFTAGLTLGDKSAALETPRKAAVYFVGGTSSGSDENPVAFVGSVNATVKLTSDGPVTFYLFAGPGGGFEIELGAAGTALYRIEPGAAEKDRRKQAAKSDKAKLAPSKACDVVVDVNYPKFTVTVNKQEALTADLGPVDPKAERPRGSFGFGIEKGKLRLDGPLKIEGDAQPAELERRIGDTEVMVRRALDPDLEQIERFRNRRKAMMLLNEAENLAFSSDHIYFLERLQPDYNKYEELKKNIGGIPDKQTPEQWKGEMDALIRKHPDVPSLYHVRAIFEQDHQDLAGALADLRKAVELFPEFPEAWGLQAQILLARQEPDAALAAIRKALDARPDYVEGYVIRARCVYATSLSMQAFMDDLDIARKLDPQDSQALTVQRMLKVQRLGPRELGCRFEYETAHYRVTTDISAEATRRYGDNLEAAWRHYASSFKGPAPRPGAKPRVSIFMTAENYYTYFELLSEDRGQNTLGVFWPGLNELVLFEKAGDLGDTTHTLYHEAVHQFMTLLTNRTPPFWYNEGIAEYMGAIEIKDGKVTRKGLILERLPYAQLAIEVKADLTFDKIMNETPREFYSGNVGLKYAQAWSMIHFFYEFDGGKYRPLIERYFGMLRDGRTPRECFDGVFKGSAEKLQEEWRGFTKGLKLN